MAISTNGAIITRLAGALYNTQLSNGTYNEVIAAFKTPADINTLANYLVTTDFGTKTTLEIATTLTTNLGLTSVAGLDNWIAAQLTASGNNKGAKIVELLNGFANISSTDATYGALATAFNAKVDAALAASQVSGAATGSFSVTVSTVAKSLAFTTAVDTLTGGAGDDTFTASAINATTGADATTINNGDTVVGGAGNDTLTLNITATQNASLTGLSVTDVENIVIVGSDNLGGSSTASTALAAATTAKAAADLALVTAQNEYNIAVQVNAAYTAVKALSETNLLAVASLTTSPSTAFTLAQYKAAAVAAQSSLTGGTLISSVDDTSNLQSRATVLETEAAAVVTAKGTALTAASAAAATAATNYNAAAAAVTAVAATASVSAATFVNATSIAVDGAATNVTSLTDTKSVTLSGTSAANTLKYSAGATTATVKLSGYKGTITLDDNSTTTDTTTLKTLTLTGTVGSVAGSAAAHTASTPGTVTIADNLGTSNGETVETLNLGLTSAAIVSIADLDTKLATINASTSTGALTITANSAKLGSVVGGTGVDTLDLTFATDVNGITGPVAATVDSGAGADKITISGVGTGTLSVSGGADNDQFTLGTANLTARLTINGGDGTDKIKFTPAGTSALTAGELALLTSQVTSVERAEFPTLTALDASKVPQYTTIDLGADTLAVTKIAAGSVINSAISSTNLQSASYIGVGSTAGNAMVPALTATTYGGALTVNQTGASKSVVLNAESATLNVSNTSSTTAGSVGDQTASTVTVSGDLKTLVVNLTSGNDYVTVPTTEVLSTVTVSPVYNTVLSGAGTQLSALGALTSVTFTGKGNAVVDNSAGASTSSTTKLLTIDASALGGTKGALYGTSAGQPLGGLTYTGNTYAAETVILGAGLDTLTLNSTYEKMDTITNFKLVGNADLTLNTNYSDVLVSTVSAVKVTSGLTGSTLGAVLTQVAALGGATSTYDAVVFQYGGDTYFFKDSATTSTTLDNADTVVKFTGLVDLDLLVLALA